MAKGGLGLCLFRNASDVCAGVELGNDFMLLRASDPLAWGWVSTSLLQALYL